MSNAIFPIGFDPLGDLMHPITVEKPTELAFTECPDCGHRVSARSPVALAYGVGAHNQVHLQTADPVPQDGVR